MASQLWHRAAHWSHRPPRTSTTTHSRFGAAQVLGYFTPGKAASADDDEAGWQEVPIPADCQMGFFADQMMLTLRSDWTLGTSGTVAVAGSLLAASATDVLANGANAKFTVVFTPSARVSLSGYTKTKNFLIVSTLENVKSRLHFWSYAPTKRGDLASCEWKNVGAEDAAVIRGASVTAVDSRENDFYWFTTSSFIMPR